MATTVYAPACPEAEAGRGKRGRDTEEYKRRRLAGEWHEEEKAESSREVAEQARGGEEREYPPPERLQRRQ